MCAMAVFAQPVVWGVNGTFAIIWSGGRGFVLWAVRRLAGHFPKATLLWWQLGSLGESLKACLSEVDDLDGKVVARFGKRWPLG